MNAKDFAALEVGDRIEFRSITRHNNRTAIRKVTGFPQVYETVKNWGGRSPNFVLVRFEGTGGFFVRRGEVIRRVS
jgi:hypothetical protein